MTLSGLLDFSYHSISGNGLNNALKSQSVGSTVGSATSAINFNAVEDLGGGMKGQAFVGIDPRTWANDANTPASIGRHEVYVGLSGNFGGIKLGSPNTAALGAFATGTPFGTATGTAYGLMDTAAGSAVRTNRSVRYDTPNFNGFSASLTYAPGNDDAAATAANGGVPAATKLTDLGLNYSNGPLNIAFSSVQRTATAAGAVKSTYNFLGANYTLGAAKFFVGYGDGDKSSQTSAASALVATTAGSDTKLSRVGATYAMGAVTLLGQYSTLEIGTAPKRKTTGLRADYALSKRTIAYVGYEAYDNGQAITTGLGNKQNTAMVGVRHSF